MTRAERRALAESLIADPERHTVMDERGAVRSVQAAFITMPRAELEAMWDPMHLERLARTYWKFLSRVTLGLIRVAYTQTDRAVVLIARPLVLLRFHAPEYELGTDRGVVRWRIASGLLVAAPGRDGDGYLEIDVRRHPSADPARGRVRVEVEVANFYPALASWFTRWFYANTQSRIHVLVTHGFLRSLASLELERSAVGRFAVERTDTPGAVRATGTGEGTVTVGDTPWGVVAGLVGAMLLAVALRRGAGGRGRRRRRAGRRARR